MGFITGRKDIKLVSVKLAGKQLSSGQYQVTDKNLVIESLPEGKFDLEVEVDVKPKENTSLEGLYNSSGTFCTQCEAEGFRGITYFYDRSAVNMQTLRRHSALQPHWGTSCGKYQPCTCQLCVQYWTSLQSTCCICPMLAASLDACLLVVSTEAAVVYQHNSTPIVFH